jgi:hypothetical protein
LGGESSCWTGSGASFASFGRPRWSSITSIAIITIATSAPDDCHALILTLQSRFANRFPPVGFDPPLTVRANEGSLRWLAWRKDFRLSVRALWFGHRAGGGARRAGQVTLRDLDDAATSRGIEGIRKSLTKFAEKGTISAADAEEALGRITLTTDLEAAADSDIVIEAVFEKLEVKQDVFRALDRICKPETVLGTNTSAIPITQIAAVTSRPENVVGTHFFSPVPMMKLCELVSGHRTSDEALATASEFAEGIGKTCIVVNRDIAALSRQDSSPRSWSRR